MRRNRNRPRSGRRGGVCGRLALGLLIVLTGLTSLAPGDGASARTRHRHGVSPQIINGTPVPPGQDRFVVALLDRTRGTDQFDQQFCGGSIIGRRYVLTAAHCLEDTSAKSLAVLIDQVELDAGGGVTIGVKRAIQDPNFNSGSFVNDAAVLTLKKKIPGQRGQQIAMVGPGDDSLTQGGDPATVAGWGNTSTTGNDFPTQMMQADIAFVADDACTAAYGSQFDPTSMVCAAGESPSRDSCQGDSGGPLFVNGDTAQPLQLGIVSWGNGCAESGFPGVYTRLSDPAVANWIRDATTHRGSSKKHRR